MVSVPDQHLLRIAHAPLHGPDVTRAQMKRALELDPCSIGWSEAYRHIPWLHRRLAWRIAVGHSETSLRGPGDVPVMVRRHHKPVDRWAIKACDAAEPLELAPERWITGFAYRHPLGVIEHIDHHPDPLNAPRATLSMRRAYRESMERLEACVTTALEQKRLPVVTGDFQLNRMNSWDWSPRQVFGRLGLKHWSVGVDWIAWHRDLVPVDRSVIRDNGQDHPWLTIDFEGFRS